MRITTKYTTTLSRSGVRQTETTGLSYFESYEAFTEIYVAYIDGVVSFLRSMLGSREEAEETAQEVFLRIWESGNALDPEKNIKSYLFTYASRMAIDKLRHRKVRNKYVEYAVLSENGSAASPDQELIDREEQQAMKAAIDNMPPRQREIFVLSFEDDVTDDELAVRFNISKRTVQTHLYNATQYLKHVLKRA